MRTVTIRQQDEQKTYPVPSLEDWKGVAASLLPSLRPGTILALSGPLGAGKTTFVQVLAEELGADKRPQSPTFALLRTYSFPSKHGIERLIHVDAYRIEHDKEMLALDLDEELADGRSMLVIEWPEHVSRWIKRHGGEVMEIAIS